MDCWPSLARCMQAATCPLCPMGHDWGTGSLGGGGEGGGQATAPTAAVAGRSAGQGRQGGVCAQETRGLVGQAARTGQVCDPRAPPSDVAS